MHFVAAIPRPYILKVDPMETEGIIEVPISSLLDKSCLHQETEVIGGQTINTYTYYYQGRRIWGATARILNQFLDIFAQVMGNKEC